MIHRILYDLGIWFYSAAIRIKSISNEKARKWVIGRRGWYKKLEKETSIAPKNRIWIHCASLGEFEQGRPVIDAIRSKYPNYWILITFFSPSGFEVRDGYHNADLVFYLPIDTKSNAKAFLELVQPNIALFVKYEFWYHYLHQLKQSQIPVILFSAIFRREQIFFKWYGSLFRKMLKVYSQILVQDKHSKELLEDLGNENVMIVQDTRFDRVAAIAKSAQDLPLVKQFCDNRRTVIAGSTWSQDLHVLKGIDFSKAKLVIAPHDLSESAIKGIEAVFLKKAIRYSNTGDRLEHADVLIIDNIGMLASIYKYGDVAYVGGGFGEGIHNTLEPAVCGIPVLFGPKFQKFREAQELIECGGAFSSTEKQSLSQMINKLIANKSECKEMGQNASKYVHNNKGGTREVLKVIDQYL